MKIHRHSLFFVLIVALVGLSSVLPMKKVYAQKPKRENVSSLIQKLKDKNPKVRKKAAQALGKIKDVRAVEPLIAALKDENPEVRLWTVSALGNIRDARAVEPLIAAVKKDKDGFVQMEAALALAGMGQYVEEVTEGERLRWGQYNVVIYKLSTELSDKLVVLEPPRGQYNVVIYELPTETDLRAQLLQIQDRHGKVLRQIQSPGGADVRFLEMTGGGELELHVNAYNRGSCCRADLYFTQDGGLRNLLIFLANIGGIPELRDLNGDGRPELIAYNDVLLFFGDLSRSDSPGMVMVIGWDGKQYRDQTRRYPTFARKEAQEYRDELLGNPEDKRAALGYYANSLAIGENTAARAWLRKYANKDTFEWLFSHEEELRTAVSSSSDKICVSQKFLIDEIGGVGDSCPK